jgi:16S rRNA (guanine527-N7)-methyltransferase
VNLTAITEEREAIVKHFVDSLTAVKLLDFDDRARPLRVIDIGTGAGFPMIPLLILHPHWKVTLVDSVGKKLNFVRQALETIGLQAEVVHGRAEDLAWDPNRRERYDLGIARAVADMPVLAELLLPFVKVGGQMIAMKGPSVDEELQRGAKAIRAMGGGPPEVTTLTLPDDAGDRSLVHILKGTGTPKQYPRKPGTPKAQPIL